MIKRCGHDYLLYNGRLQVESPTTKAAAQPHNL